MDSTLKLDYKNTISRFIGTEGVTDSELNDLAQVAQKAILETNKDRNNGLTPYRDLPYIQENLQQAQDIAESACGSCSDFIVIADGAFLPIAAAFESFNNAKGLPKKHFCRISEMEKFLKTMEEKLETCTFNFVSQSQQNCPTAGHINLVQDLLRQKCGSSGINEKIIITCKPENKELLMLCEDSGINNIMIAEGIPAEMTVLDTGGLLNAALCGLDLEQLLAGARAMDLRCGSENILRNPAAFIAAMIKYSVDKHKRKAIITPQTPQMMSLTNWTASMWQQQTADKSSPVFPIESKETVLSNGQQADAVFNITINTVNSRTACNKTPRVEITFDELNSREIGEFLYLMETASTIYTNFFKEKSLQESDYVIEAASQGSVAEIAAQNNYEIIR